MVGRCVANSTPPWNSFATGQRRQNNGRRERCLAETDACGIENRIVDSRRDGCDGALTCAWRRRCKRVEQHGNDHGQGIAELEDRVGLPVKGRERARSCGPRYFLMKGAASCPAGRLLPSDSVTVRVSKQGPNPGWRQAFVTITSPVVLIHRHFRLHRRVSVIPFVQHTGDATASHHAGPGVSRPGRVARVPTRGVRYGIKNTDQSGIAQMAQPELNRVGAYCRSPFVHKRLLAKVF